MPSYSEIFENNRQWVAENGRSQADYFARLSESQSPDYFYIGCSDSRVTAEEMMGLRPGEAFIHRNVANLVHATDFSMISALTYAVVHLKVKHIIVCGHYNCGGVKAAMLPEDLGMLNPWLRAIRDVYRHHAEELNAIEDEGARYDRLVELNVQEQCINIIKFAEVQRAYLTRQAPTVHGWVFDLRNGLLKDLEIDFQKELEHIQEIYNLTGSREKWYGNGW